MERAPYSEKIVVFFRNFSKDLINFSCFLFWFFIDPKKFVIVKPEKIKSILVIGGGAMGDSYNIIGAMNAVLEKYPLEINFLTLEKNRKFVKNPNIKIVDLGETKELINRKKIDAAVLIDPGRQKEIFDREIFLKLLKVPYLVASESIRLHPHKLLRQYFPILASRKIYPIGANGPETFIKLFRLLGFDINFPSFYFTQKGKNFARNFLKEIKDKYKIIIVHPGAGKIVNALKERKTPAHLWPIRRWASLIDKIVTNDEYFVIITGVSSEAPISEKVYRLVKNKKKVMYAVGKIPDIESLASVVKGAAATVTIDTSMAHVTSQVGTPATIIYGSDSPSRIGPISEKNIHIYHPKKAHDCRKYACKYCCEVHMKSISVDEVYYSFLKIIK